MMQPFYVSISAIISNCNHTHVCCYILLFMLSICYHGFCILCGRTIPTTRLVSSPTLCWWPQWHFSGFPLIGRLGLEPIVFRSLIPEMTHIKKMYLVTKNLLFLASLVGLVIITSLIVLTDNLWLQEKFEVVFIFEQQILQIPPVHQNLFRLM